MHNKSIGQVQEKHRNSQFWPGLMRIKECFLGFGSFSLNNGANNRFGRTSG
jgi:hypothetical protein